MGIGTLRPAGALHVMGNVVVEQANRVELNTAHLESGLNTTASGDYSTALGYYTIASGNYSTALGRGVAASGYASTALGYHTTARETLI